MTVAIDLVYSTDPRGLKLGGLETYTRDFTRYCDDTVHLRLVGIDTCKGVRLGRWNTMNFGGKSVDFFPTLHETDHANTKKSVPLNLRFILSLIFYMKKISRVGSSIDLHRADHILPFVLWRIKNPIILTIHGASKFLEVPSTDALRTARRIFYPIERIAIRRANKVFFVSHDGLEYYSRTFPAYRHKFDIVPTWVDVSKFFLRTSSGPGPSRDSSRDEPLVLFIGRLDPVKDPLLALRGFKEFLEVNGKGRMVFIGEGELIHMLRNESRLLKIQENVSFRGAIAHDDMPEIIRGADATLVTSHFEGMPRCVLESLACGVPVAAIPVGDIPIVVRENLTGALAQSRDPHDVAAALGKAVRLRQGHEAYCVESIQEYRADRIIPKIINAHRALGG